MSSEQPHKVRDYVEILRQRGRAFFAKTFRHAVLLHYPEDDEESGGFFTQIVSASVVEAAKKGLLLNPGLVVHPICKRLEGPFQERIGIGRARNTDMPLVFPEISKYHAYFVLREDEGAYYLADAGSKNGTFLNDVKLEPRTLVHVPDRTYVRFAHYSFRFHEPDAFVEIIEGLLGGAAARG